MIEITLEIVEFGLADIDIYQDGDFLGNLGKKGHAHFLNILFVLRLGQIGKQNLLFGAYVLKMIEKLIREAKAGAIGAEIQQMQVIQFLKAFSYPVFIHLLS